MSWGEAPKNPVDAVIRCINMLQPFKSHPAVARVLKHLETARVLLVVGVTR